VEFVLLEEVPFFELFQNFPILMIPEGALPFSKVPANNSNLEPDKCSPDHPIIFL
jgi:hypothetical protein